MSVLEPGAVFGRDFRIVKALRAGGMGAVYVAEQISTGKLRALKVMAPELASDPAIQERFVLEARAAASIESDHVVEIVTAGVDEATRSPFLVMELLRGEELAECLARTGKLPLGDVAEILQQVGHALEQAHRNGIVHRDLKLENIFLCASRRRDVAFTAKILDFGIAKLVENSQKTGTQPLGTPLFMSPEQTDRKGRICPATDVWALGLIAFRLLTGHDFWRENQSLAQLLREIVVDALPFASVRAQELGLPEVLPPGFDAWFARCVNRDIDARFPEAGEAVRAFAELVTADAPRGMVVVAGSAGQPGSLTGSLSGPQGGTGAAMGAASVQVTPAATGGPVSVNSATIGATGDALVARSGEAAAPARGPRGLLLAGGAVALLAVVGVAVAVLHGGGKGPPADPARPAASQAAAAASAAPAALAEGKSCPAGMVLIPGGKMFMGARDLREESRPPHEVTLSSFCLDRTEVTTRAYEACANKSECERALEQVSWPGLKPEKKKKYSPFCNAGHKDRGEHPINCVAWPMADNYCKKHGGRLPSEAEWEYAARGSDQRRYPWGDEAPSAKRLNACGKECAQWGEEHEEKHKMMYEEDDGFLATAPVGSFPQGAAMHGVMDLAGNVWEWTADWYAPYTADAVKDPQGPPQGTERVARGGDYFGFEAAWARPAYRWKTDPETYNHAIGFRCAADPR